MRIPLPGLTLSLTVNRASPRAARASADTGAYSGDGLTVQGRILDAITSGPFLAAYAAGMSTPHAIGGGGDLQIHWRVHTCLWAARHALALAGDFVECGVNTGIMSRAICEDLGFGTVPKQFFLFDTFKGIPEEQAAPDERDAVRSKNARIYRECYDAAQRTFADFPNVRLVRGIVPESLQSVSIDQVAYLSIDMNLVHPEIAALEYFWDRLVPGALVVLDDYAFAGHRLQHDAVDRFAAARSVPVYSSPTGQGIIIRPPG